LDLRFPVRVIILTFLLFAIFSLTSLALFPASSGGSESIFPLLLVCLLNVLVLSLLVVNSRVGGIKLVLVIFSIFFGVSTLLSQIETLVFLNYFESIVPSDILIGIFVNGLLIAAIFSPLAVLVLGRIKDDKGFGKLSMSLKEWFWKLTATSLFYVIVYISFGMFVFMPLAGSSFQEYYGNLQLPQWILPFQWFKGLIWVSLAVLIIKTVKGSPIEVGLITAMLFSVLMASSLLLPNEFMPKEIRFAHFVEIMTSNFLFGLVATYVLYRGRGPEGRGMRTACTTWGTGREISILELASMPFDLTEWKRVWSSPHLGWGI